jgi:hypothetical protein
MEIITEKNGDKFIKLTKREFDENFIFGCLWKYSSNGDENSEVLIKIYGQVPDLKYCVAKKNNQEK